MMRSLVWRGRRGLTFKTLPSYTGSPTEALPASAFRHVAIPACAMSLVILLCNVLVQFPINQWLTWGAFVYPVSYLVTELTNRWVGPGTARRVVWIGFTVAALLSAVLATPRIALASATAFIVSQMLDISVFNRLRREAWWRAPLAASVAASVIDTFLFFSLAFGATHVQWFQLAIGDLTVKIFMSVFLLIPFRTFIVRFMAQDAR